MRMFVGIRKVSKLSAALLALGLIGCADTTDTQEDTAPTKTDALPETGGVVDVSSVEQALSGYTSDPCTTVTPDMRRSLGTGAIPAVFFNAPDANYGHPGCEDMFVVEVYNTLGNNNPLYLAANWAPPGLPQSADLCAASWVHVKWFGQFASGSWYLHNDKNIVAQWDGHNCFWPNEGDWGPATFYTYTPAKQYQKLRIAVTAAWLYWKVPAQAYLWPK